MQYLNEIHCPTYPPANKWTSVSLWLIILACSARQRTSGLRQRVQRGLGSCPSPLFSASEEIRTSMVKRCPRWSYGRASLPWFRLQRADNPPPPSLLSVSLSLSACSGSPLTQIAFLPLTKPPESCELAQANCQQNYTSGLVNDFEAHPRGLSRFSTPLSSRHSSQYLLYSQRLENTRCYWSAWRVTSRRIRTDHALFTCSLIESALHHVDCRGRFHKRALISSCTICR